MLTDLLDVDPISSDSVEVEVETDLRADWFKFEVEPIQLDLFKLEVDVDGIVSSCEDRFGILELLLAPLFVWCKFLILLSTALDLCVVIVVPTSITYDVKILMANVSLLIIPFQI